MRVLALIPARADSKSLLHKNIRPIAGKPLMVHSIEQALSAKVVDRTLVSTDNEGYAAIARKAGAEVPFLRPAGISGDLATDLEVFQHALNWLVKEDGWCPDLIVHLRPTHPIRRPEDIDAAIQLLVDHKEWDAVRSISPAPYTPYKMWTIASGDLLTPVASCGVSEAWNQPRQALPEVWIQNACIDVTRATTILELGSMTGRQIGAFRMSDFHDIDTLEELESAMVAMHKGSTLPTGKTFVCDIDGVIATLVADNHYEKANPQNDVIDVINRLYDAGNHIILFTARGSMTGIDWSAVTSRQLSAWGVRHHELRFGKPAADYYIDDRFISLTELARWTSSDTKKP